MRTFLLATTVMAITLASGVANAQSTIFFEDFEDAAVGYTTSVADDLASIANRDYFGRIDAGSGLPADVSYSNMQGTGFYGVQDSDSTSAGVDLINLDVFGLDVTNFTGLEFSFLIGEDTAGDGNEDWDISTSFRISAQIDGGGFNDIFAVESVDGGVGNRAPARDTNFDGVGDGAAITDMMTEYMIDIANGNLLDIRITIEDLDTGDEDIAFDNLKLTGVSTVPEPSALGLIALFGSGLILRRRK